MLHLIAVETELCCILQQALRDFLILVTAYLLAPKLRNLRIILDD